MAMTPTKDNVIQRAIVDAPEYGDGLLLEGSFVVGNG